MDTPSFHSERSSNEREWRWETPSVHGNSVELGWSASMGAQATENPGTEYQVFSANQDGWTPHFDAGFPVEMGEKRRASRPGFAYFLIACTAGFLRDARGRKKSTAGEHVSP